MADESGKKTGVRTRLYQLTIAVLLLVGAGGLLYPLVSAAWNAYREQWLISSYSETVKKLDDRRNREIWEDALAYNRQHRVNAPTDAFGKEKEADLPHPYADLLNPNGDGVMGYIEIPKIALSIPIGHGTGPDVLERGCGARKTDEGSCASSRASLSDGGLSGGVRGVLHGGEKGKSPDHGPSRDGGEGSERSVEERAGAGA